MTTPYGGNSFRRPLAGPLRFINKRLKLYY